MVFLCFSLGILLNDQRSFLGIEGPPPMMEIGGLHHLGIVSKKSCTVGWEIHDFWISCQDVCIALWVQRSGSKIRFESHLTCYDTVLYQYFPTAYNTFSIVSTRSDDFFFVCATRPTDSPENTRETFNFQRCAMLAWPQRPGPWIGWLPGPFDEEAWQCSRRCTWNDISIIYSCSICLYVRLHF